MMEQLIPINNQDLQTFITNPESLKIQDPDVQIAIATYPQTPVELLAILVNSELPEVVEAVQLHVNYAGELNQNGYEVAEEKINSRNLGQNDKLAVELLKIAPVPDYFLSKWVPADRLIEGLSNSYLPLRHKISFLSRLAQDESLEARLQVAEAKQTPIAILQNLIGNLELPIRLAVEHHPNCPPQLVSLVKGQQEIASDWNTDKEQLESLSNSNWDWIRLAVAQNPTTSEETLLKLAGNKLYKIQLAVAKNPNTPASILKVLAQNSNHVQVEVVRHPNATEEILHSLFETQQSVIKNRENLPASILERIFDNRDKNTPAWKDHNFRYYFRKQPNTPTWILGELADIDIEQLTAERLELEGKNNRNTGIHKKWVSDDIEFLANVAEHSQVSTEILEKIIEYPNQNAKLAVAQNNKISPQLKLKLFRDFINDNWDYECQQRIVKIAENPDTPVIILEELINKISPTRAKLVQKLTNFTTAISEISSSLLDKLSNFIDCYQSPEQILSGLRKNEKLRKTILQDWTQLTNSLNEVETQHLMGIAQITFLGIGMSGSGIPRQD